MENYLESCLNSLLTDNMSLIEVLVINDGSKDSSYDIAHRYETKYPEVFVVIDKGNGNYGVIKCIKITSNCNLSISQTDTTRSTFTSPFQTKTQSF